MKEIEQGLDGLIEMIEAYMHGNDATREIIDLAENGR